MEKDISLIIRWMTMSQNEVLNKFQTLQNSFSDGKGQDRFVWIPGTRPDRCLLVAHADTVWGKATVNPIYSEKDDIIYSGRSYEKVDVTRRNSTSTRFGIGIGADDRAGCFALWNLRNLGHSLLITSGEEEGCVASKRIMSDEWWRNTISEHQFAVQFDRRGHKDIVFYNIGTNKFAEYVKKETEYTPETGSYTDIRELCLKICGVNISIGFHNEHTPEEKLVVSQMLNTIGVAYNWLSKKDIPKFPLDPQDKYTVPTPKYNNHYGYPYDYEGDLQECHRVNHRESVRRLPNYYQKKETSQKKQEKNYVEPTSGDIIICNKCSRKIVVEDWFESVFRCPWCNTVIE